MAANPYEAPQSRVADVDEESEFQPIKMWSAQGRVGRLRYVAYTFGASVLIAVLSAMLTATMDPGAAAIITLLAYVPLTIFCILVGIQRSHDMNWSGWMLLLSIIPFVGLIWLFKSGTRGLNDYGNPPPPNTLGVKLFAILVPIAFIGILAAIAIPAYQQYVERATMQ